MNKFCVGRSVNEALTAIQLMDKYVDATLYGPHQFKPGNMESMILALDEAVMKLKEEISKWR